MCKAQCRVSSGQTPSVGHHWSGFSEGCTSSHVLAGEKLYSVLKSERKPVILSLSRESSFRSLLGPVRQPGGSSSCGVSHSPPWTMSLCREPLTRRWPHLAAGSNFSLNPVINGFEFAQTCQLFEAIACCARVGCRRGNASFVSMVSTLRKLVPTYKQLITRGEKDNLFSGITGNLPVFLWISDLWPASHFN